jgi:phage shock protein E
VDVRTDDEYADKHIDRAINVPVDDVSTHDFGAKDTPLVLYCQKGPRSERAAQTLRAKGYTRVYVLGPMSAWDQ